MAASTTAASSSQQLSSASNENNILIDLSSLSSKQRIKEYKVTNKDLKSKDVNKKLFAIEKVNKDIRYFLEGDCLPSLLEAIIPKKVGSFLTQMTSLSLFTHSFCRKL